MESVDALAVLTQMLVDAGVDVAHPSADDVARTWEVFEAFAAVPVTDDRLEDDALLAEFGTYGGHDSGSDRRYQVSLTRQLTIGVSDEDQEADNELFAEMGLDDDDEFADEPGSQMYQLHCTYFFSPSPALEALGAGTLWTYDCPDGDFFQRAHALAGFKTLGERPAAPENLALSYSGV